MTMLNRAVERSTWNHQEDHCNLVCLLISQILSAPPDVERHLMVKNAQTCCVLVTDQIPPAPLIAQFCYGQSLALIPITPQIVLGIITLMTSTLL